MRSNATLLLVAARSVTLCARRRSAPAPTTIDKRRLAGPVVEEACAAIQQVLQAHPPGRLFVQLGSAWSRLMVLPWVDQLTSEDRWGNYARARFEQVYGDDSDGWELRLARDLPGRGRLAVAWPAALGTELRRHKSVRSVRLALLEHLGLLLEHEPQFSGCVLELEANGAGFLLLVDGEIRRVRWCRFGDAEGLLAAVRSEWVAVESAEAFEPLQPPALALAPPAPERRSERGRIAGG